MDGKASALFQGPECFQEDRLPVMGRDIVIYVIAGNRIKALIRKIQMQRIALSKADITDALCLGIPFAERFTEGSIFPAPAVNADDPSPRISLRDGDAKSTAPAANVQAAPALRQLYI